MRKLFFLFLIIGLACRVYAQCSVVTISPTYPTVCGGSGSTTITANPTGGAGPYTYSWNTGQTTQSIVVTVGGTYIVTVSSPGCPPVIDSVKVIQATIPAAWNSGPVCEGSTLFLSAANFDNATYSWTGPNSFTDSIKEPFINNVTFSNAGVYKVSVTVNGCKSAQGATTVTVVAKPPTPVAGNICRTCRLVRNRKTTGLTNP